MSFALFSDLVAGRKREVGSAVAHYIAGVLDRKAMVEMIDTLCQGAEFKPGDRVRTLRGSLRGRIVRLLDDGRIVWQPDGARSPLTSLPEALCTDKKRKR